MSSTSLLRVATWVLAFLHTFPARKHVAAFVAAPSLDDGWKGAGALVAIVLYLLPLRVQRRALVALWRERRHVLRAATWVLVVVHAIPAVDHVPRWVATGAWPDAWRGVATLAAVVWFLLPVAWQARAVASLGRIGRDREAGAWRAATPNATDVVRCSRPREAPESPTPRAVTASSFRSST